MRRAALLFVLTVACDRGQQPASQGSAMPAPQANLMSTVARGVFEQPRVADVVASTSPRWPRLKNLDIVAIEHDFGY